MTAEELRGAILRDIDQLSDRVKAANTYRGRVTNYGEERLAVIAAVRELVAKDRGE